MLRTPHDALERRVVDSAGLLTDETWLEAFGADCDEVTIRKLVDLLLSDLSTVVFCSVSKNERNVAHLLLDNAHKLACRGGAKEYPQSVRILIRYSVRSAKSNRRWNEERRCATYRRQSPSRCPSGVSKQTETKQHDGHVERLKNKLRHALSEGLEVQKSLHE